MYFSGNGSVILETATTRFKELSGNAEKIVQELFRFKECI